ncbi:MAG: DUF2499 domain-containing protein, partial [Chloroflexaceae bacterium]|nr:DUF2499 domain-containing protein [Chloroflexaceae bacterium]
RPFLASAVLGELPALASSYVCLYLAFFDNLPALDWLVDLQATLTVLGNVTLCAAAWWIWRSARLPQA